MGIHRLSMDIYWLFIDNPWISIDYPGIYRTLFVAKWHATQVERISTKPISMICSYVSLQISSHPGLIFMNLDYYYSCYFGRNHEPPRISWEATGDSSDHFGGILRLSDISRNPQIMTNRRFSVSCNNFRRDPESRPNSCPAICQPLISNNMCFELSSRGQRHGHQPLNN